MNPDKLPETDSDRVAYQQVLPEDKSVFSIQWITIPSEFKHTLTSATLLTLYLNYIERITLRLIQPEILPDGVIIKLAGTKTKLICFAPPSTDTIQNGEMTTLRICGGLLVQPLECNAGQLDFIIESIPAGSRVTLRLSDYAPLLLGSRNPSIFRRWLYRFTQALIHKIITVRFLAMTYQKTTGLHLKKRTLIVVIREGINT